MNNDTIVEVNEETNETTIKTRNVNQESFVYNINKINEKLQITSVSPSGIVKRGVEPISVELEVKTSKGAEDGKANCYYGFAEGEEIRFFTTGGTTHFQTFNTMLRGENCDKCREEPLKPCSELYNNALPFKSQAESRNS